MARQLGAISVVLCTLAAPAAAGEEEPAAVERTNWLRILTLETVARGLTELGFVDDQVEYTDLAALDLWYPPR